MRNSSTSVSIIIPCHNASSALIYCLQSCFKQIHPSIEILFIDNNSTDNSVVLSQKLLTQSPFPYKILHCPQPGANHARNLGFIHAQGQYIQWLDADDTLAPDKIARQVAALEAHSTADIAYSNWTWQFHHQDTQSSTQLHFTSQQHDDFLHQTLIDNWHPPHSFLIRRTAANTLHNLPAWNPNTPVAMDREHFTLAALTGHQFLYVPQTHVTYHRWSNHQITKSTPQTTRSQTLKTLYQRFQHHAKSQSQIQPHHWQLLQQSRDRWQLPPCHITQQGNHYHLTDHPSHPQPIGLSQPEAMILAAMGKTSGTYSIEDHARRILRHLWKTLIQRHNLTPNQLNQSLTTIVGLPPVPDLAPVTTPGITLAPNLSLSLHSDLDRSLDQIPPADLIDAVPLFTPVFCIQRVQIQHILEQFSQSSILLPVT
jgi:Glycosyl transferase family 2